MPMNLPQYNVKRFSIGPATMLLGVAGVLPTVDIGGVDEVAIKITAESNKFLLGVPAVPQWYRFKTVEVVLTVKGIEWNLDSIRKVMGGYLLEETIGNTDVQTLYGTFEYVDAFSIRVLHVTPAGGTLTMDVFQALPGGGADFTFGTKVHEIPYTFHAIASSYDFDGNALPPNTAFKLKLETPNG
jgi:hypothetical protein